MAEQGYGQFPNQGRFTRRSGDPNYTRRFRLPKGTGAEGTSNDTLAATLADDYFWNVPAAGPATVTATGAAALGGLTSSTTATVTHQATGSAPLGALAASTTGTVTHSATGAAALGAVTASTTATVTHNASGDAPLGSLTASTTGTVTPGGTTVTATGDAPLGALVATTTATVTHPAVGSAALGGLAATIVVPGTSEEYVGHSYPRVRRPTKHELEVIKKAQQKFRLPVMPVQRITANGHASLGALTAFTTGEVTWSVLEDDDELLLLV